VITVDVWETIRIRCRRDGEKIKPVARDLGIAPNTVRKYLRQIDPPSRKPRPRTFVAGTLSITHRWADSLDAENNSRAHRQLSPPKC
jgi:anti-sigma regulatory factor (Ser/Thr protein kinase)